MAHIAYHVGQIVYLGKWFRRGAWKYLTIPPGQSADYNANPVLEKIGIREVRGGEMS